MLSQVIWIYICFITSYLCTCTITAMEQTWCFFTHMPTCERTHKRPARLFFATLANFPKGSTLVQNRRSNSKLFVLEGHPKRHIWSIVLYPCMVYKMVSVSVSEWIQWLVVGCISCDISMLSVPKTITEEVLGYFIGYADCVGNHYTKSPGAHHPAIRVKAQVNPI